MDEGGEQEQRIRAGAFARLPGISWLTEMNARALREAVDAACRQPGPPPGLVDLSGAETTARLILAGG